MAFAANFTVGQSNDGTILTFTDTSNYGATVTTNKSNFTSRTLYLTFANDLVATTVPFPYTNTNNGIQDIITYTISQDVAFVAKLDLINPSAGGSDILFDESVVVTTEFVEKGIRELIATNDLCNCNSNRIYNDLAIIEIGKISALNRGDRGDVLGAQKDISMVQEKIDLLIG